MESFRRLTAPAIVLDEPNIDTDQIIPARFLWRPRRSGYGELLFNDRRYDAAGEKLPDFALNQYPEARILLAEANFGCGSSREQAVWALFDAGIRAVIAPSFGDIFFNNCCQQGVVPVRLEADAYQALRAAWAPGVPFTVDLEALRVAAGDVQFAFALAPFQRQQLLEGLDDVAATLRHEAEIAAFEAGYARAHPWVTG
jgi:3-isopropylmalate/(R)-2-methylmalate dehydratase small subunit